MFVILHNRDCQALENVTKITEKQKNTHAHFRGGISMGIGSFNLVRAEQSNAVGYFAFQPHHIYHGTTGKLRAVFTHFTHFCAIRCCPCFHPESSDWWSFWASQETGWVALASGQPCSPQRLFRTLMFPTQRSCLLSGLFIFSGAWFVRAETGSGKQQPAVHPQHLDSAHVPSLHYGHPGWGSWYEMDTNLH